MGQRLFSIVSEKVSVLRYCGKCTTICDTTYIGNKFQIAPHQYADFKALVGDFADNIKGAEMIGPKTAATLLRQYDTLEGILSHAEEIERKVIRESVIKNAERLRVNYEIIKLQDSAICKETALLLKERRKQIK